MASRWARESFWFTDTTASPPVSRFVNAGALRDSAEQAVVENPGAFSAVPLTAGEIHPRLLAYHAAHARGPEL